MEKVGVEAVVEGLMSFASDMDTLQGKIDDVGGSGTILGGVFDSVTGLLMNFGREVLNVAEVALGTMLRDAIEGVINAIGDLVSATIEAGNEFQTLELRLNNFNLDALMKSGMGYNEATSESIKLTQEQLFWLQKLAMTTPYDNTDISNVYSLGRAYNFTDEQARQLTVNTAAFASAMGLTKDKMKSIIINLGQMKARGKITGTELRDLARGAFLPLDDVLGRVAKSMGVTTEALTAMISKPGEGVPYQNFIDAFNQMIEQEPRFVGASEKMARTFKAASANVMDLATSFGGLNIVTPILDKLGAKIAGFMDSFIQTGPAGQEFTALGQRLYDASVKIGDALAKIISNVFALLPSSNDLATQLVNGIEAFANWLDENEGTISVHLQNILLWFLNLGKNEFINNLLTQLGNLYNQLFAVNSQTGRTGWDNLTTAIDTLGKTIGVVLAPLLDDLNIKLPDSKNFVHDLVQALNDFSAWLLENQEGVRTFLVILAGFLILQVVAAAVASLVSGLIALTITVVAFAASVLFAINVITTIIAALSGLTATMLFFQWASEVAIHLVENLWERFKENVSKTFASIMENIRTLDWIGVGIDIVSFVWNGFINSIMSLVDAFIQAGEDVGGDIVKGMAMGVTNSAGQLVGALVSAAMKAYTAAKNALGIKSPSTLFAGIGENIIAGMAEGIYGSANLAVDAMRNVVSAVSMPAMSAQYSQSAPASVSTSYQNNVSNNLTINSSAQSEPIIADFVMMNSWAGA